MGKKAGFIPLPPFIKDFSQIRLRHKADCVHAETEGLTQTSVNIRLGHRANFIHAETDFISSPLKTCFHIDLTISNDRPRHSDGFHR